MKSYNKDTYKKDFFIKRIFFFVIKKILKILFLKKILCFFLYKYKNILLLIEFKPLRGLIYDVISEKEKFIELKSKDEKLLIFSNDKYLSRDLFINNEFDLFKLEKVNKIIKNNNLKTLYDIGANIVVKSIPALNRGYFKYAHAVEPEMNNFNLLEKNVQLNNLHKKIFTYNYALSNSDDAHLQMELSDENSGDHRVRLPNPKLTTHDEDKRSISKEL